MKIFIASGFVIEAVVVGCLVALIWFPSPWPSTAAVVITGVNIAFGLATAWRWS